MEGIYLGALIPLLEEKFRGLPCTALGLSSSFTMSLDFRGEWLHLHARPDGPGLWCSKEAATVPPASPSWEHHLRGAVLEGIRQQGFDRVLEMDFFEKTPYQPGGATLVFELTGRNANVILLRRSDGRILASMRKVLSSVSRYRTVSPGVPYKRPPSSGHPPGEWGTPEVQRLLEGSVSPGVLYRNLEGVGPVSAKAIISHSKDVAGTVKYLGKMLIQGDFTPWETPFGPVPVPLGTGRPVSSPLAPPPAEKGTQKEYRPSGRELESLLRKRISSETKRMRSTERSLGNLKSPEELRNFGNIILTYRKDIRKGMTEALLQDWDGTPLRIPLKPSLNPPENAEGFFRKAGKIHLERNRLEKRLEALEEQLRELNRLLGSLDSMDDDQAAELLAKLKKPRRKTTGDPIEYILHDGWRCLVGRNARQNDRLTFKTAGRDDIWLHARGVAGAHVIIRRDGRPDNPGRMVLEQAAAIAARHSTTNGVVPVDWTLARYVRRMRGGGPGQVVYTREKTVFAEV